MAARIDETELIGIGTHRSHTDEGKDTVGYLIGQKDPRAGAPTRPAGGTMAGTSP